MDEPKKDKFELIKYDSEQRLPAELDSNLSRYELLLRHRAAWGERDLISYELMVRTQTGTTLVPYVDPDRTQVGNIKLLSESYLGKISRSQPTMLLEHLRGRHTTVSQQEPLFEQTVETPVIFQLFLVVLITSAVVALMAGGMH